MRLLVLGGTHFLGRHVATAALERGHDVATFTRGVSGEPPEGARALHGDRDDPDALPKALDGWAPELVVDTSCQTRAAAANAAAALADVAGYAFVSSLNAYRDWPPGPDRPRGGPADLDHRRRRVRAEQGVRRAGARRRRRRPVPHRPGRAHRRPVRPGLPAGLVAGPDRAGAAASSCRRSVDQPIALVDARDLAGWLVEMAEQGRTGAVNATGPAGMTTLGGLLDVCREVTGGDAEWVPVPEEELLAAGVQPWVHLPLWLPAGGGAHGLGRRHHPGPRAGPAQPARCGDRSPTPGPGSRRRAAAPAPAHGPAPGLPAGARGAAARRPLTSCPQPWRR